MEWAKKLILPPLIMLMACGSIFVSYAADGAVDEPPLKRDAEVLVLMYTGIVRRPDGKNVSMRTLKKQMEMLKDNGYRSIRLKDFLDFYYKEKPLPAKSVLITFDGGRKDSCVYADKVLKSVGYNAAMFIIPEKINSGDHFFICWHDVKNMVKNRRWEFGLTSQNGYKYITIDPQRNKGPYLLHRAWLESQKRFESDEELSERIKAEYTAWRKKINRSIKGLEIYAFSVPYGNYVYWKRADTLCMALNRRLAQENFKLLFLQDTRGIVNKSESPLSLGRLVVKANWTELDFARNAGLTIPQVAGFLDDFDTKKLKERWLVTTGNAYGMDGELRINPFVGKNDAFLYLLGSESMDSSIVETEAEVNPGTQFWLYIRFFDINNNVRFGLSKGNFYLQRLVNGRVQEQVKGKDLVENGRKPHTYKLIAKEGAIIAVLDNSTFGKIKGTLVTARGPVAFETWDKIENAAGAKLSYFSLKRLPKQWFCITLRKGNDANTYKETLLYSSVISPLCYEFRNGKVSRLSDIDLSRMLAGHYGLLFVPRIYIASFNTEQLKELKSWTSSLFKKYSIAGINLELSDELCDDTQSVNTLIDGIKGLFQENDKEFVITVNIPQRLEDFYREDVALKCDYVIAKNRQPSENLLKMIRNDNRLIRSVIYDKNSPNIWLSNEDVALAIWEE